MEAEVLKYGWLIVLTLAQIVLFVVRNRGNKKEDNPSHGERLATLEKGMETVEERLGKIENKLNEKK